MPQRNADPDGPQGGSTVTLELLRSWPLPAPDGNKNSRGTVMVVGGASRSPGGVLLAGLAALRAGAGRLQLAVAAPVATALAIAVPEAMVLPLPCDPRTGAVQPEAADELAPHLSGCDALCIGPGLDDADRTDALLDKLRPLVPEGAAVVLDAYALGVVAGGPGWPELTGRWVLTPNVAEAGMLLQEDPPAEDRFGPAAGEIAGRYGATVTLHGHTCDPGGGHWVERDTPAGLGTSGSGDVLAGTVAGLLARGAEPAQAAVWAGHLHTEAGRRLTERVGPLGFLARELLVEIPAAMARPGGPTSQP